MYDLIGMGIGIVLAFLADRWTYGRTLLQLAQRGLGLAKSTGYDEKLPDSVRRVAEQAIIAANQREVEALVKKLTALQLKGLDDATAAYERGKANAQGMQVEIIDRTGDESWSKPFKRDAP